MYLYAQSASDGVASPPRPRKCHGKGKVRGQGKRGQGKGRGEVSRSRQGATAGDRYSPPWGERSPPPLVAPGRPDSRRLSVAARLQAGRRRREERPPSSALNDERAGAWPTKKLIITSPLQGVIMRHLGGMLKTYRPNACGGEKRMRATTYPDRREGRTR